MATRKKRGLPDALKKFQFKKKGASTSTAKSKSKTTGTRKSAKKAK